MRTFTLLTLFVVCISAYSQDIQFKYSNSSSEGQIAVFSIVGIQSDNQTNQIITDISNLKDVLSFRIFYNKRAKLVTSAAISAKEIRSLLKAHDVDFDYEYFIVKSKSDFIEMSDKKKLFPNTYKISLVKGNEIEYPDSYPKLILDTKGKPDKKANTLAKTVWIESHPEEWKSMTGREYLDYSYKPNHKK